MPALPKPFYFETTFGLEWEGFWDSLWLRAKRAISNADEVVIIGYSLPVADERARVMLLDGANKDVRLSICCGNATARLEHEFRDRGFNGVDHVAMTFEDYLKKATAPNGSNRERRQEHAHAAQRPDWKTWPFENTLRGRGWLYVSVYRSSRRFADADGRYWIPDRHHAKSLSGAFRGRNPDRRERHEDNIGQ